MSAKQKRALYIVLAILAALLLVISVAQWRNLDNRAAADFIAPYAFQCTRNVQSPGSDISPATEPLTFQRKDLSQPDQSLGFYTLALMDPNTQDYRDQAAQIQSATTALGLTTGVGLQSPDPAGLALKDLIVYQGLFNGRNGVHFADTDPVPAQPVAVAILVYRRGDRRQPLYAYAHLSSGYGSHIMPLNAEDDAFAALSGR